MQELDHGSRCDQVAPKVSVSLVNVAETLEPILGVSSGLCEGRHGRELKVVGPERHAELRPELARHGASEEGRVDGERLLEKQHVAGIRIDPGTLQKLQDHAQDYDGADHEEKDHHGKHYEEMHPEAAGPHIDPLQLVCLRIRPMHIVWEALLEPAARAMRSTSHTHAHIIHEALPLSVAPEQVVQDVLYVRCLLG